MKNSEYKSHWENIYENKNENEVSWFQKNPETSTDLIKSSNIDKTSKIIDAKMWLRQFSIANSIISSSNSSNEPKLITLS